MAVKRPKSAEALTLVEVLVATLILAIAASGALSHQYHTAGHAHIAKAQTIATNTAQLLLEDWKGASGAVNYNPAALGLGFSPSPVQPKDIEFVTAYV
ncbi:MAG: prepilin-type N-terminal cleavage/methylation domain-containing protein [Desulfobacteraceae bacterium]|nr:prepilin-type N-terminal cleavage/methylation domain-containing protein [Desulfobacteraceae bacterium]